MGGVTVAYAAAEYPNLPRALILEDPVGIHEDPHSDPDVNMDEAAANVREQFHKQSEQSVEAAIETEYEEFDANWARCLAVASAECSPNVAKLAREGYPKPLREVFSDISCPTLVLRSDADTERRVRDLTAADALSNGRLVHVPDAGHYVFHDEYDAADAELRAFLRRV